MTTPTLPDRLRALFASRVHHFTPHGQDGTPQSPAFAIVATAERLADLLTAADRLDLMDAAETLEQVRKWSEPDPQIEAATSAGLRNMLEN